MPAPGQSSAGNEHETPAANAAIQQVACFFMPSFYHFHFGLTSVWRASRLFAARDVRKAFGKPAKEVAWHVSSLDPDSRSAEEFAGIVRTHWYVETYHGKRDNGYHEDAFTRRCDLNVMAAMMVARSFGMWICARHPDRTVAEVRRDLALHPSKLFRVMTKGGLQ